MSPGPRVALRSTRGSIHPPTRGSQKPHVAPNPADATINVKGRRAYDASFFPVVLVSPSGGLLQRTGSLNGFLFSVRETATRCRRCAPGPGPPRAAAAGTPLPTGPTRSREPRTAGGNTGTPLAPDAPRRCGPPGPPSHAPGRDPAAAGHSRAAAPGAPGA